LPQQAAPLSPSQQRLQSGATVTMNGKSASVTFKDINTLLVVTPALTPGPQQIIIANPDGESVSLDDAFTAN